MHTFPLSRRIKLLSRSPIQYDFTEGSKQRLLCCSTDVLRSFSFFIMIFIFFLNDHSARTDGFSSLSIAFSTTSVLHTVVDDTSKGVVPCLPPERCLEKSLLGDVERKKGGGSTPVRALTPTRSVATFRCELLVIYSITSQ